MEIKVISAVYASPFSGGYDVTADVQKLVNEGKSIFIEPKTFNVPDPGIGQTKGFTAIYKTDANTIYVGGKDGDTIKIPN